MRRIGLLTGLRGALRVRSSVPTHRLQVLNLGRAVGLLIILAMVLPGCSDQQQNSEPAYGSAADYASYGYNDPYADPYASWPYDPLLYSYWYSQPSYYYRHAGDNDHDCDDGYCGPHSGHRRPPIVPRPLPASRPLTATRDAVGVRTAGGNGSGFHSSGGFNSHASSNH
jgi:hypothetical protein